MGLLEFLFNLIGGIIGLVFGIIGIAVGLVVAVVTAVFVVLAVVLAVVALLLLIVLSPIILLLVIIFSIERFITLKRATGKGRVDEFLHNVRQLLASDRIDEAMTVCDEQQGSVANVMRSGLVKYQTVLNDNSLDKETRINTVKQEIEEATALELPMLSKNLVIISTCASVSTLFGLIGTVLGMIRAFSAMATAGAPDATALSTGISEALINTALGVAGSAIAIIMFNYFGTKIDGITHGIDEAGFSVSQTLANRK